MADKRVIIKDFTGGINRATDPCKMKENEFYDFQNLIIYSLGKIGNAVKRFGIENWHSVAVTGSKAMQIFQYVTNSKTSNIDKLIVKTDSALRSLDTLTPANAYSEIVASGDVSGKVKFLTYKDNLYIFNRNSSGTYAENKFYDGTNYLAQGTPPCLQTFSISQTDKLTGELEQKTYKYFVTYVYDKLYESFGLFPNVSGATWFQTNNADAMMAIPSITINDSGKTATLGSIPTGNARVTSRRIYRTKGDLDTFYFLAEIPDNTTNYFVDGNADSKLGAPLDLSFVYAPPIAKYAIEHKGYMFMGNLKENTYKAPTIVTSGWTSASSGGLSKSGDTRKAKYSYKFAELNIIPSLESSGTSGEPYQGYWGDYTSAQRFELTDASHGKVNLVVPTANAYTGRIAIFRNTCLFPTSTTSYDTGQVTFTFASDPQLSGLKVGDTVIIDGFTSFSGAGGNDPNGTFTVLGFGVNSFSITFDTVNYATFASEGRIMPENYYLEGFPSLNGTAYVSTLADTVLYANTNILSLKGLEQVSDKVLPSTVVWGNGDQFTDSIEVAPNDNDVITGFASEDDGLLIFKERKIYKLYTMNDPSLWQLREVANVGCTEPYSICTFKAGVHSFISNGQIWIYSNGQTKKISDKIQPIIDGLGTITNTDVCYHPEKNWLVYTLGYAFGTITANEIFILDLNFPSEDNIGVWYYFATTYGTYNALSVRSPISTKQGKLLFGSDLVNVLQYNKTGIYTDYINASGSAGTANTSALLRKYFDFDEWKITRLLMKFTIGTIDTLYYAVNSTTSLTSLGTPSTGRVNVKAVGQTDVKRAYIFWFSEGSKAIEIQEVGFDYIPKHEARGSY